MKLEETEKREVKKHQNQTKLNDTEQKITIKITVKITI